jgi:hypothetical protein
VVAGLIACLIGSLAACADGEAAQRISDDLDVVDVSAPGGTTGDLRVVDQTKALVCDTDRQTLLIAIEAFTAMQGRPPTDETELVGTFLREPSSAYDIAPDGTLIPVAGSPCA